MNPSSSFPLTGELLGRVLRFQRDEITEHEIYRRLARVERSPANRQVLERIAADELAHYRHWRNLSGREVTPNRLLVGWYYLLGRVLGVTFSIKLMERGEQQAQANYASLPGDVGEAQRLVQEENEHEQALIQLIDEERLRYAGSVVLGLNDALVELTGALAGLTLAFQNTRLIALSGAITGIAAALSMAASEYLSTKSEKSDKHPVRAALYTGTAYILTVLLLISPYLVLENYYVCLACSLGGAVAIIAAFNFYIAIAQDVSFRARFLEMAGLSLTVAAFSFGIGYLLRQLIGVEL